MFPNYKELQKMVDGLYEQFDIETRLKRYGSVSPELIEMTEGLGLPNNNLEAARALFLADFIITSSELQGVEDIDRRKSIIEAFKKGLSYSGVDSENLMRQSYLAYSLASTIRKNDLFQAGRGIPREVALMRIYDSYLMAYLNFSEKLLGIHVDASWPLGILAAALKKSFPHKEIDKLNGLGSLKDLKKLASVIWDILLEYASIHPVETNDNPVIPNYYETSTVLLTDTKNLLLSGWNLGRPLSNGNGNGAIKPLIDFFKKTDSKMKMVYLKGHFIDQPEPNKFILVRDSISENHPLMFMKTPVDDVNVTSILSLLKIRGMDAEGWKSVSSPDLDEVEIKGPEPTEQKEQSAPQGFFGKLMAKLGSVFGRKRSTDVSSPSSKKKTSKPNKSRKAKNILPQFLAQSITIDAVSDMAMFSTFDTIRESEYVILGAMESNFEKNEANFMGFSEEIDPELVAYILDGLDEVLETATNHFFNGFFQLVPEEIVLFLNEEDKLVITLAGDKKRIVGTIAHTNVSSVTARYTNKANVSQRRTLHMRTGQLHSSLQHTPFDTAVTRIYAEDIKQEPQFFSLDKSILNLA